MPRTAQHVTLTAGTPTTVTLTGDWQAIDVVNVDGRSPVYYRFGAAGASDGRGGTVPAVTVKGDDTGVVPAVVGASVREARPDYGPDTIQLVSAAAVDVAVVGVAVLGGL